MRTVSSAASNVASGEAPEQVFYDAHLRDSKQRIVEAPGFVSRGEAQESNTQASSSQTANTQNNTVQVADTHAHLDMLHHPGLALARAAANKVNFVVSVIDPTEDPSYTLENLESWRQEAAKYLQEWKTAANTPEVNIIMGCHPHNASAYSEAVEEQLLGAITNDDRVVGIGEIGLDYHYDNSPRDVQKEVFRRQINLAHEHECKIALHLREAHEDGLRILKEEGVPEKGVLLHCFNLDYATLEPFLELGTMVAFGGPLTFKKADEVRDAAARTPIERLVTETDCPFMAPVPIRGSVCEPASVIFTAALLEELRDEPDTLDQLFANAKGFFA